MGEPAKSPFDLLVDQIRNEEYAKILNVLCIRQELIDVSFESPFLIHRRSRLRKRESSYFCIVNLATVVLIFGPCVVQASDFSFAKVWAQLVDRELHLGHALLQYLPTIFRPVRRFGIYVEQDLVDGIDKERLGGSTRPDPNREVDNRDGESTDDE